MKKSLIGLLSLLVFVLFIFLINEFQIFGIKFWGTRMENAKREKFENTQAYVESKRQDLLNYYRQWKLAKDSVDKQAIEFVIRNQFANFDEDKIEQPELKEFLKKVKYE